MWGVVGVATQRLARCTLTYHLPRPALGALLAGGTLRTIPRCELRDERRATSARFTPTDSAEEPHLLDGPRRSSSARRTWANYRTVPAFTENSASQRPFTPRHGLRSSCETQRPSDRGRSSLFAIATTSSATSSMGCRRRWGSRSSNGCAGATDECGVRTVHRERPARMPRSSDCPRGAAPPARTC